MKRRSRHQKYDEKEIKLENCFNCTTNSDCKSNYCHKIKGGYRKCKSEAYQLEEEGSRFHKSKCFGEICKDNNDCQSENCTSFVLGKRLKNKICSNRK